MLKKSLLLSLLVFFILPVSAGEVEKALGNGNNVFLYLYTQDCKYCKMFSPVYEKIKSTYNGKFCFFKVDASTKYGQKLMNDWYGAYVPYVVLLNASKKEALRLPPQCMMNMACIDKTITNFRN